MKNIEIAIGNQIDGKIFAILDNNLNKFYQGEHIDQIDEDILQNIWVTIHNKIIDEIK